MRRFIIILIVILVFPFNVMADTKEPKVYAQGAVLMEYETGRVLWQKNMNEKLPMASTTKIMTAIIALESGKLEDITEASSNAAITPKVRMGVAKGEKHRLYDLLYPLMLMSANDAAVVIAEHLGGSVEGFANIMNKKAKEIGAVNTEFVTPNGLDKDEHHSTAYDMALITRYALKNDEFVKIINTQSISIPIKNNDEKSYEFYNKNRLLKEYNGAIGVKTGFTGKAGNCFVGAAKRDDMELISVVLASGWGNAGKERKWSDTKAILDYGFNNFSKVKIIDSGYETGNIAVYHSKEGFVGTKILDDGYAYISKDEIEGIKKVYNIKKYLDAPIKKNDVVGKAEVFTAEGEKLFETDIVACESIERHDFFSCLKKVIDLWLYDNVFI